MVFCPAKTMVRRLENGVPIRMGRTSSNHTQGPWGARVVKQGRPERPFPPFPVPCSLFPGSQTGTALFPPPALGARGASFRSWALGGWVPSWCAGLGSELPRGKEDGGGFGGSTGPRLRGSPIASSSAGLCAGHGAVGAWAPRHAAYRAYRGSLFPMSPVPCSLFPVPPAQKGNKGRCSGMLCLAEWLTLGRGRVNRPCVVRFAF